MSLGVVLWKAIDGREFVIDTKKLGINTVEELQNHIAELRRQHGYEQPDPEKNNMIVHAHVLDPKLQKKFEEYKGTIKTEDLPEDLKKVVVNESIDALKKPNPKKLD